jgi:hypothetical protein
MKQPTRPESRPVERRAIILGRCCPARRGGLLAVLGLLAGSHASATNITSCPVTISQPGSYTVTQDLTCTQTAGSAISIQVAGVTLSLGGHTITGPGVAPNLSAIGVNADNCQVSNGSVTGFLSAVDLEGNSNSVSGLTITRCGSGVYVAGQSNTVSGNSITGSNIGILVNLNAQGNAITGNTCDGNGTGIEVDGRLNTITGNTALHSVDFFDLDDAIPACGGNVWSDNSFCTANQHCIGAGTCGQSSITCPPNQTVTAPDGHTSASVDAGTPTSSLTGVPVVGVRSDGKALTDPYPAGTTTVTWTVNPGQENAATCTQTIMVQVGNAPNITCPGSLNVTAPLGQSSVIVVVGTPTSTSEGATIIGVRSDGKGLAAPYPVGTTTITWTASVSADQSAACTQTITVQAAVVAPAIIRGPNQADPHLDSILVDRGPLYQRAILHGRGFADVQGTSIVTLGGNQIPVLAWTNDAIDVLILPQAYQQTALALNAAYPVQVVINANGRKSNTVDFFLTDGSPPN